VLVEAAYIPETIGKRVESGGRAVLLLIVMMSTGVLIPSKPTVWISFHCARIEGRLRELTFNQVEDLHLRDCSQVDDRVLT
jgi:hypothetical protein